MYLKRTECEEWGWIYLKRSECEEWGWIYLFWIEINSRLDYVNKMLNLLVSSNT